MHTQVFTSITEPQPSIDRDVVVRAVLRMQPCIHEKDGTNASRGHKMIE
jgi:hypothetical protein